jgi:hypothetical protein
MRSSIYTLDRLRDLLTSVVLYLLPQTFFPEARKAEIRSLAIGRALKNDARSSLRQYNVLTLGDTYATRAV